VVVCAGPWSGGIANARVDRPQSLAFNLLIGRPAPSDCAVGVTGREGTYFLLPWKSGTLAGTFHTAWAGSPADPMPSETVIQQFLEDLNGSTRGLDIRRDEVLRILPGLLPADAPGDRMPAVRDFIWTTATGGSGAPVGLVAAAAIKFTTARATAEECLRLAGGSAGFGLPSYRHAPAPARRERPDAAAFLTLIGNDPVAAAAVARELIRGEAVLDIDDLMLRRSDWGLHPLADHIVRFVSPLVPPFRRPEDHEVGTAAGICAGR
jgi:glycerol-3-phosphate dehydrogenase